MTAQKYHERTRETAQYPKDSGYAFMGLVDEIQEVIDLVDIYDIEMLKKELGDVTWYISSICYELNLNFVKICKDTFVNNPYLKIGTKYDNLEIYNFFTSTMLGYAAKICGRAKKIIRDGISKDKVNTIKEYITKIIGLIYKICEMRKIEISDIFQTNIDKLSSRKERGVLSGDGDNR